MRVLFCVIFSSCNVNPQFIADFVPLVARHSKVFSSDGTVQVGIHTLWFRHHRTPDLARSGGFVLSRNFLENGAMCGVRW
jgi:hypothetical protein